MLKASNAVYAQSITDTARGEARDCTVRALATAACIDYDTAHAALADAGRTPRKGCGVREMQTAIGALGFKAEFVKLRQWAYPFRGCGRARWCGPTLAAFIHANRTGHYVVFGRRHAVAVVDGELHDWVSRSGRQQVDGFWKLV